jgi:hypothetical protein
MEGGLDLCLDDYPFDRKCSNADKAKYGEIYTPRSLVESTLDMLPNECFSDPSTTWLDPGAGTGHFSLVLFHRLMNGLRYAIPSVIERKSHIIGKMLHMVELKPSNAARLCALFGPGANVTEGDFTAVPTRPAFDFVVGNPPYNADGTKKVPTNSVKDKRGDGRTVWSDFVRKAAGCLRVGGRLLFIVPSIWMKPDRAGMYQFMTGRKLERIACMSSGDTIRAFEGAAQTPTCCVLLKNTSSDGQVELFDKDEQRYVNHCLAPGRAIPTHGVSIVNRLLALVADAGALSVTKTNMPPACAKISTQRTRECSHRNIRTCVLDGGTPRLRIDYSDRALAFAGVPKLVLAHKMHGLPYLDASGEFGISNRDAYVISGKNVEDLERIGAFLRTRLALYVFEAARYRMRYLERYAFEFLPDITKLPAFPSAVNDTSVADYIGLSDEERDRVSSLHRKDYSVPPLPASE